MSQPFDPAQALVNTPKTHEGAIQLYNDWAPSYDETLTTWGYEAPAVTAKLVKQYIDPTVTESESMPLHDCGCGTGMAGQSLRAQGFINLLGSDCSAGSFAIIESRKPGLYRKMQMVNLEEPMKCFPDNAFSATVCVGVTSYITNSHVMYPEWVRTTTKGGLVVFTIRTVLWEENTNNVKGVCEALEAQGAWERLYLSDPSPYMPLNPVKEESDKRLYYLVYRVL